MDQPFPLPENTMSGFEPVVASYEIGFGPIVPAAWAAVFDGSADTLSGSNVVKVAVRSWLSWSLRCAVIASAAAAIADSPSSKSWDTRLPNAGITLWAWHQTASWTRFSMP